MKIEVRGVLKTYRSLRALDFVSLEIEPGQIVGVLGANGAGKTTLLRCLAGIAAPDKGEVLFDGEPFRRDRLDMRSRLYTMPDFPFFFWEHSIVRNLAMILRVYDADSPGNETRVLQLLRDFDLLPLALRRVQSLSRGQIYKAGLVAMIAADRDVWLLDEPFASGMDPHGIDMFKQYALEAVRRGRTVIYTTQLLDIAERFSDRLCLLDAGEVRAFDSLENLRMRVHDKGNVLEELFRQLREGGST
ncbi:MAG: ABC transporter ATP-binding protein [Methylacidiphilales bacterium]|nr:ABC transporter ATP-binding protein [Candidatus Methylacidiphilales bacterium]